MGYSDMPMSQPLKEAEAEILQFKPNLGNTARLYLKTKIKAKANVLSLKT